MRWNGIHQEWCAVYRSKIHHHFMWMKRSEYHFISQRTNFVVHLKLNFIAIHIQKVNFIIQHSVCNDWGIHKTCSDATITFATIHGRLGAAENLSKIRFQSMHMNVIGRSHSFAPKVNTLKMKLYTIRDIADNDSANRIICAFQARHFSFRYFLHRNAFVFVWFCIGNFTYTSTSSILCTTKNRTTMNKKTCVCSMVKTLAWGQ